MYGNLYDADTDELLREATPEEAVISYVADDGGVFPVDWRSEGGWQGEDYRLCYVDDGDEQAVRAYAAKYRIHL